MHNVAQLNEHQLEKQHDKQCVQHGRYSEDASGA